MRTNLPWPPANSASARTLRAQSSGVDTEPQPGELHADVRIESLGLDRSHGPLVLVPDRVRLVHARHLLAEDIERRFLPHLVQSPDGGERVGQLGPGDVPVGEPSDDPPRDGGKHPDDGAVEEGQGAILVLAGRPSLPHNGRVENQLDHSDNTGATPEPRPKPTGRELALGVVVAVLFAVGICIAAVLSFELNPAGPVIVVVAAITARLPRGAPRQDTRSRPRRSAS